VIKRVDLERHLRRNGCALAREGAKHSVWHGPSDTVSTVPRHREIPRATARAICRQLDIPEIA
jgi:mRNA interferase HicA